jgi:hypothetical protein
MTETIGTDVWASRIVGQREALVSSLVDHPLNWRAHPEDQWAALEAALGRTGYLKPVVVQAETGVILDGHLRVALAREHAIPTIPVVEVDVTDEEARLILAGLDRTTEYATTDADKFRALLQTVATDRPSAELYHALTGERAVDALREGMAIDHGAALLERGEDGTVPGEYGGQAVRTLILVMDQARYDRMVQQFQDLMARQGFETTFEAVTWLTQTYG